MSADQRLSVVFQQQQNVFTDTLFHRFAKMVREDYLFNFSTLPYKPFEEDSDFRSEKLYPKLTEVILTNPNFNYLTQDTDYFLSFLGYSISSDFINNNFHLRKLTDAATDVLIDRFNKYKSFKLRTDYTLLEHESIPLFVSLIPPQLLFESLTRRVSTQDLPELRLALVVYYTRVGVVLEENFNIQNTQFETIFALFKVDSTLYKAKFQNTTTVDLSEMVLSPDYDPLAILSKMV